MLPSREANMPVSQAIHSHWVNITSVFKLALSNSAIFPPQSPGAVKTVSHFANVQVEAQRTELTFPRPSKMW